MPLIKIIKTLGSLIFLLTINIGLLEASDFLLIVNAENNISGDPVKLQNEVKHLFLKEQKKWSNGIDAKPLSAKSGSEALKAFIKEILIMDSATLAQHWLSAKQKTGDTPPREISSTRSTVKLVARKKGAFGFVLKSELPQDTSKIRILFEF